MSARCKQEIFFWGKKSCFMQETKNFRQHPPPFLIVISYFFIDTSTIELNCHNQARNSH